MSRTYKDTPWKLRYPEQQWDYTYERIPTERWSDSYQYWYKFFCYLERPGVKTKKKRHHKEYDGMHTPNWYVHEYMTRPQRAAGKLWEKSIVKVAQEDLIDQCVPDVSRKPHWYYW